MLTELKISVRQLAKSPGFTVVTVLTLALGIGACTALFSVVNSLLLRPTPLRDLGRIVFAIARSEGEPFLSSPAEYEAWRDGSRRFTSWGAAIMSNLVMTGQGAPEQLSVAALDPGYLSTLGVTPLHGRAFTVEETSSLAPLLMLSHAFWQNRFGADPTVLGRSLVLDGVPRTIIGILPPGFDLPRSNQVYRPYTVPAPGTSARLERGLFPVARLAPGSTLEQGDAEIKAISARLAAVEPATQKGWSVNLIPLRHQLLLDINGGLNRRLLLLGGAVGLLLLVACANVGNLTLARALGRSREFAVCSALGASRAWIVRHLLIERGILAVLGGGGGLLSAVWLTPLLHSLNPVETVALSGTLTSPSFDGRVLAVTGGAVVITLVLAGLPAVWSATRLDLNSVMYTGGARGSTRSGGRWRDGLIVAEIAVCLVLLIAAVLLGKSFVRIVNEPLGFDPRGVLAVRVAPSLDRYPDQATRARFADAVLERVRALPGVQRAGLGTTLPFHLDGWSASFRPETGPKSINEQDSSTTHRVVTPGYLETMGMQLMRGRLIDERDQIGSPAVAVITETFAKRIWPGEDPLGKRLYRISTPNRFITVVGLVAPVKEDRTIGVRGEDAVWYLPYAQTNFTDPVHIVVKSSGDPQLLGKAIAGAVHAVDPQQPVFELTALESYVAAYLAPERFAATLVTAFAILGLLLAALGIYGVSAYFVGLRQREIGVRLSLGATPAAVQRLVFVQSLRLLVLGLGLGSALALILGKIFASVLHKVSPTDPSAYIAVSVLLSLVAVLATLLPARRATKVDPMIALRAE